jgi:hypothetical protein
MQLSVAEIIEQLNVSARSINSGPLGLAVHNPEAWGQQSRWFENVVRKVQQDGGRVIFGWMFQLKYISEVPELSYLIATHHAVWQGPERRLIDVIPFHSDLANRPLAAGGDGVRAFFAYGISALTGRNCTCNSFMEISSALL